MKNKIMFVCQYFYPEKVSSGVLPYEMASKMSEAGFEVSALVGYPKEYATNNDEVSFMETTDKGVKIKRIRYIQSNRSNFIGRILNYVSFCFSVWKNRKEFKNIDKCICYTNPPLLPFVVARLSKKYYFDMFFELYDLYPDVAIRSNTVNENNIICRIMRLATDYALKNAKKIILLSSEMEAYLLSTKRQLNLKNKCIVIPNWYKRQNEKKERIYNKPLVILYGGNMGIMQEMDTLVNTIISLKNNFDIRFIIAGHGIKKESIEKTIKKQNIMNCEIYDFLPKEEYDMLMKKVDLAVVSLETFGKGLGSPSKVYSYLSSGIPIIAIMPDNTDIVNDIKIYQCGVHITQGDYQSLTDFLIQIKDDTEKLVKMGLNAKKLFDEKYDIDVISRQYEQMFREEI